MIIYCLFISFTVYKVNRQISIDFQTFCANYLQLITLKYLLQNCYFLMRFRLCGNLVKMMNIFISLKISKYLLFVLGDDIDGHNWKHRKFSFKIHEKYFLYLFSFWYKHIWYKLTILKLWSIAHFPPALLTSVVTYLSILFHCFYECLKPLCTCKSVLYQYLFYYVGIESYF